MSFLENGLPKIKQKLENGPCLVAKLGALLLPTEKPEGKLRAALEASGVKTQYGRDRTEVYAFLPEQEEKMADIGLLKLGSKPVNKFRLAVRYAFSKSIPEQSSMYLVLSPKIRYEVVASGKTPPEHSVLVDEEYRIPGVNLTQPPIDSRASEQFIGNVVAWSKKYSIASELLEGNSLVVTKPNKASNVDGLLQDFLNAQPADIRSRVNIPGFMLEILLATKY